MIDPNPPPSRQLRLVSRIARWLLGLMLAMLLLLAVAWGVLHVWIVPRIDGWRTHVEGAASRALGAPVRIEVLQARTDGLFPEFELQGVQVLDAQSQPALHLPRVVAGLSARSLLRLGLDRLVVDGAALDVRHLPGGRWQVAGMDVVPGANTSQDSPVLQWLLEQPTLEIRDGRLRVTDAAPVTPVTTQWRDVHAVLRNGQWRHSLQVQAWPLEQGEGAQPIVLKAQMRQPLLPAQSPLWQRWSGHWEASVDVQLLSQLPLPPQWGVQGWSAEGTVQLRGDVEAGRAVHAQAQLQLPLLRVQWQGSDTPDLALQRVQMQLLATLHRDHWQLQANALTFVLPDGVRWPSSNWQLALYGPWAQPTRTRLELDYADLSLAHRVLQALPLPQHVLTPLARWQPQGQVRAVQWDWRGAKDYEAKGQVEGLTLLAQPAAAQVGIPGVQGLDAHFALNAQGGQAQLRMQSGVLDFPGVFEASQVPMDALQAQVHWRLEDGHLEVQVPALQFRNADAQGHAQATWHTGTGEQPRLPGYLDLNGVLERANGASVHRYLPLAVGETARHYVRDSVRAGEASGVQFEVRGMLRDMPFKQPGSGRFYIHAPLRDVIYDFAPERVLPKGSKPWPVLQQVQGDLVFDGASMAVQHAQAQIAERSAVHMDRVQAQIADLAHPHLDLQVGGQAPLQQLLDVVRASPLAGMTGHALDSAQAEGVAQLEFQLALPIADAAATQVAGYVGLQGNGLQLMSGVPALSQLKGQVHFSEHGFELREVQGQAVGGPVAASGGMPSGAQGVNIAVRGTATAQGLAAYDGVPVVAQLGQYAQGAAPYSVQVQAAQGETRVTVQSDLQGLSLDLPLPLNKSAEARWPLRVTHRSTPGARQWLEVAVPGRVQVGYVQDTSMQPHRVVAGQIVVGDVDAPSMPVSGVHAQVALPLLDVDAWTQWVQQALSGNTAGSEATAQAFVPQRVDVEVGQLRVRQRVLEQVQAQLQRSEGLWRGQLQAPQLAGYVEYRMPSVANTTGRVYARLKHLTLPQSAAQALEVAPEVQQELHSLPALDIEVQQLEVAGKALGQLHLQARNRVTEAGREWWLQKFALQTPEAQWQASGFWQAAQGAQPGRTHLNFLLDMDSAGLLLERFGMGGVIRAGQGRLNGEIAWQGSPLSPHWPSMDGAVHLQLDKGQFLKVEPGMGKLLSVLSLQSLSRRVALDFRDVFSQGFAFDFIRGDVAVQQGVARTNNLQMKGLNAAVLMEGQASLAQETQDLHVVVVPEINAMTASLAATVINPVVGVGSFLAQMFLRGPLIEAATRTFRVHGTWSDPLVDSVRKAALQPLQPVEPSEGANP